MQQIVLVQWNTLNTEYAIIHVNISMISRWNHASVYKIFILQMAFLLLSKVGNEIIDHPDVVAALPVGTAPATSSFST